MGRFTDTITQLFPQAEQPPLDPAAEARVRTAVPDNVATAQKLSAEIGLDPRVAERNLEEVQQRYEVGRFQQFLREHPEAQTLGAEFGAVAKDDVGPLSRLAAAVKSGSLGAGAGLLTTLGAIPDRLQQRFPMPGFIQGEDGKIKIVSGTEYNRIVAERRAAGQVSDVSDFFMFAGQRGAERAEAAGREAAIPELREIDSPAKFLEFGGLHLAQSLPYMLLARTSPTLVAGSIGGNVLEERVGDGEVTDQDVMIAMSAGIVSGMLEKYGADKVLGAIPNLSSTVARRIGTATVAEAATEFAQEGFVEYVGETLGISEFDLDEALYRGASGALAGGFSGGTIRTSAEALVAVAARSTQERVDANADMLKKLASAAEASALRERNPAQFKEYVDTLAPDTDIFFDAADAEALLQSSVLEETELPDDLEARIAEAAEHDTPVRISAAEYATYFADAHTAQALSLRARVGNATAMNAEEAKNIKSEFAERAEQAILAAEDAEAARAEARKINEDVLQEIMSTGRFRQDVATTYATLVANFFVTMASRAGTTPSELYARYPLKVRGAGNDAALSEETLKQAAPMQMEKTDRGVVATFQIGDVAYTTRLETPDPKSVFMKHLSEEVGQMYGSDKPALELDFGAATLEQGFRPRFEGRVDAPNVAQLTSTLISFARTELAKVSERVVMVRAPVDSQDKRLRIYERGLRRNITTHDVVRMDEETIALVPRGTLKQSTSAQAETEAFKRWAGTAAEQVIYAEQGDQYEGGPAVFEGYHGTTHGAIDVVDTQPEAGTTDSWLGKGFYVTTSVEDASANYAGIGPDLTGRIERAAEELGQAFADDTYVRDAVMSDWFDNDMGDGEGVQPARDRVLQRFDYPIDARFDELTDEQKEEVAEVFGNDAVAYVAKMQTKGDTHGLMMPVWVKFENPFDMRPGSVQSFDIEYAQDEETGDIDDSVEPTGPGVKLVEALHSAGEQYGIDVSAAINAVHNGENAYGIFKSLAGQYIQDPDTGGSITTGGFLQDVARQAGFDGMIMDADAEFGTGRRGFGGVRVPGMAGVNPGTLHMIPFEPTQVKSSIGNSGAFDPNHPSIVKQGDRGSINMSRDLSLPSVVRLFKNADLSTFLHESGHFFFEVMADMAARPDASPAIRADMEALLRWVKFEGTVEQWRAKSIPERREAHEQFARGFEAWLMEGSAPNEEMRGLFHRFRAWLVNIYKSVAQLNVELTDEVRTVMSHMVATDEQIAAAQAARSYAPLFDSAQAAGMTPEEWQAYQDTTRAATEHAQDALQARSMRNLRWLDNARARELKKLQAENKAKRDAVRAEVEAEVAREPARVAETFLLSGKAWVENLAGVAEEVTVEGPHKFSVAALEEAYGTREEYQALAEAAGLDAKAARAPWESLPRTMLSKDGGLSADEVAELTGFKSGDQLIAALIALPNREVVIQNETNRRVMERYGDLNNPQTLARAVDMAVHNQHRTRVVAMELQALDESLKTQPGGIATVRRAARDYAQKVVQRLRIRDVRPNQYLAAESKAARESRTALAAGDLKLAATRKRDQLFNGYASRDANRALELIDKGLRYLKRFQDSKIRARLDPAYRDQIDKLLERYDLKRRSLSQVDKRTSLAEWIKEQEAQGNDPIIPDELRDESKRTNYQNLTVEQFAGLVDSVKNIEHLANLKRKLLAAKEQRDFDTAVEQLVASIDENSTGQLKEQLEKDLSLWGRFADTVNEWFMHLRKMASVVRQIDGVKDGGRMWEYFMRPINAASDKEVAMRADATRRLSKLLDSLPALRTSFIERLGRKVKGPPKLYIAEIDQALSLEARLAVALNWGNEGNRERIREGNRWTDAQIEAVINTLTKEEMDFVQGVWNFIGSYWDEIASKEERVTGVRPVRVEPTPVITQHGTYEGGYYPIVADPGRSERAAQLNDAELIGQSLRGAVTRATTRRGHTKARVGGKDPVRLDLGVITQHVSQVIHDLSWHEVLIDSGRLLRDKRVSQALRDNYGAEVTRLMRKTLDDVARGEVVAQDAGERLANYFRVGSTVAGLGFSVTTALLQPTGITQSMVRVGYRHVARGLLEFMARPAQSIKKVREASTFMRDRGLLLNRELGEITNKLDGQPLGLARFYFMPIQALQTAVDVPTWLGAYNKAFGEGETHERAVALADQAVRDSQSTGAISDLAEAQRGGAWKKLWTNFYSYFSATYQLSAESVQTFKRDKSVTGAAKMAADFIMLYTVPAALGMLIREGLRGDLDDEDPEELAEALLKAQLSYMLGVFPYVREVAGVIEGFDYKGPAGANIIAQLGQMGTQIAQGENDEALWRSINRAAGTALHYPASQVDRTVRGMIAVAEGDAGPQALLVGPPRKDE